MFKFNYASLNGEVNWRKNSGVIELKLQEVHFANNFSKDKLAWLEITCLQNAPHAVSTSMSTKTRFPCSMITWHGVWSCGETYFSLLLFSLRPGYCLKFPVLRNLIRHPRGGSGELQARAVNFNHHKKVKTNAIIVLSFVLFPMFNCRALMDTRQSWVFWVIIH